MGLIDEAIEIGARKQGPRCKVSMFLDTLKPKERAEWEELMAAPRTKEAVPDSFDWLLYRIVARELKADTRITWYIPQTVDAYFQVYDHLHLLTHGNQARGGAGIAGLATPLALLDHKKRKRDATTGTTASHTWLGHFHTYLRGQSWTVNGSGKGTDEYSFAGNFGHEPPQQAFAVITPEHNVTTELGIFCGDRAKEGW